MANETKLVNVADTTYHSSLYEFLDVAKLLEFEIGFENNYYCGEQKGREFLLFNRQEGIIIYLDCAVLKGGSYVKAATMYAEVNIPKTVSRGHVEFINRCACTVKRNDTFQMRIDCRSGLADICANLFTLFETNTKWEDIPWICFLNEDELKKMPYSPEDGILFRHVTSCDKVNAADEALKAIVCYK